MAAKTHAENVVVLTYPGFFIQKIISVKALKTYL